LDLTSPLSANEADRLARLFAQMASEAGAAVMDVWRKGATSRTKADRSPVTDADERAEAIILARLATDLPGVPVLAEEQSAEAGGCAAVGDTFLLVDPVDGTRDFVDGGKDFTVNIALVINGQSVAGSVLAPARDGLWYGGAQAFTATRFIAGSPVTADTARRITTRAQPERPTVLVSSAHLDEDTRRFVATLGRIDRQSVGSSLKFCRIAEGAADIYPRWGPTMEWDTAAGHAVLSAAGGVVLTPEGAPFLYGKQANGYLNGPFIAWGRPPA
jgi:3'(2'), 5'-bisphosphate nucleotidase